jgi:hypothetical protein
LASFGKHLLNSDLNGTTTVLALFAVGPYDSTTGGFSTDQLLIALGV